MRPAEFGRRLDNPMIMGRSDAPCRGSLTQAAQECRECPDRRECARESGLDLDPDWPACLGDCEGCDSEDCEDRPEEEVDEDAHDCSED